MSASKLSLERRIVKFTTASRENKVRSGAEAEFTDAHHVALVQAIVAFVASRRQ